MKSQACSESGNSLNSKREWLVTRAMRWKEMHGQFDVDMISGMALSQGKSHLRCKMNQRFCETLTESNMKKIKASVTPLRDRGDAIVKV